MSALRAAFQALRQTEQAEEPQIPTAWPEEVDMPPITEEVDMGIPIPEPEPDTIQDFKPNTRWQKPEPARPANGRRGGCQISPGS